MTGVPDPLSLMRPFLGTWRGEGRGLWFADPQFRYRERLSLESVPDRSLIRLEQTTWDLATGALSHMELGFLRVQPSGRLELVVCAPAGYVEIHTGSVVDGVITLVMHDLGATPTAKPLRKVARRLELGEGRLRSLLSIAVADEPLAPHTESVLLPEGSQ